MNCRQVRRLIIAALTLTAVATDRVWAQPVVGDNEVQLAAGFFHSQDSDSGNLNVDLDYGRYVLDNHWELGARAGYQGVYVSKGPDAWNVTVAPFLDYNFHGIVDDDRLIPFVGGFVGAVFDDHNLSGTVGPELGAKLFLNRQTFAGIRYRYEWFFDDIDVGKDDSNGNHVVTVSLGYVWGGQ